MLRQISIFLLMDLCFTTENSRYRDILVAFDGVRATKENQVALAKALYNEADRFNRALPLSGRAPVNLVDKENASILADEIDSIIDISTDRNLDGGKTEYFFLGSWPTPDEDLLDHPRQRS